VRRAINLVAAGALAAAGAWAADYAVEGGSYVSSAGTPGYDGTRELKWDSGYGRWVLDWYTGAGSWVGNDFDISTIPAYRAVEKIKLQSYANWPNVGWDGFRLGIYDFTGSVPRSLLWGPKFVVATGTPIWHEFSVGWNLPSGVTSFVAAMEQYYDHPNCDPYLVDNNYSFTGHSWQYYGGVWRLHVGYQGYRNVMLRVVVEEAVALTPTSLGRVKALYY
jgi:hypothetical protein